MTESTTPGGWMAGVYKVFIGILLLALIGVGTQVFYPSPTVPDVMLLGQAPATPEAVQQVHEFQAQQALQARNTAIATALGAILLFVISVTAVRGINLFSDGFLLGGVFTFAYSILMGFGASDNRLRFLIVAVGLVIALALGYWRFLRKEPTHVRQTRPIEHRRAA